MSVSYERYRGKYRVGSDRLKEWDYGTAGYYFVTICTLNRVPWFGEVRENRMVLSPVGEVVVHELQKTTQIRKNVSVDTWVVMPNHIHAIIAIDGIPGVYVETPRRGVSVKTKWRAGSLGAIINQFKSKCTKRIRASGCGRFAWQARFYDHIIRSEKSLENIRTYILGNPIKWAEDEYFSGI